MPTSNHKPKPTAQQKPTCACGAVDWEGIPDSLAIACRRCLKVLVKHGNEWEPGVSLDQWAADLAESMEQKR